LGVFFEKQRIKMLRGKKKKKVKGVKREGSKVGTREKNEKKKKKPLWGLKGPTVQPISPLLQKKGKRVPRGAQKGRKRGNKKGEKQ